MTTIAQILRGASLYTTTEDRRRVLDQLEDYLSDKDFLVDGQFSTVDSVVYKKVYEDVKMWGSDPPSWYSNIVRWFMRVQNRGVGSAYSPLDLCVEHAGGSVGKGARTLPKSEVHTLSWDGKDPHALSLDGKEVYSATAPYGRRVGELTGMMGSVRLQKVTMAPCSCCHHE